MANQVTGFTRIYKAAGYSWKGLKAAWQNEAAFRQEASAAIPLIFSLSGSMSAALNASY